MMITRRNVLLGLLGAATVIAGCSRPGVNDRTVQSIAAPDGVEIHYEVAGRGEPTLVFVHGWSCDRSYWRAQIEHFAKSHRVVAIDLGGHGESGLNRADWTIPSFARDVRAVVEALDIQDAVLVGHSMGGAVVAEAARRMPKRVAAVIPVDSFTAVLPEEQREAAFSPLIQALRADFRMATGNMVRQFMLSPNTDPDLARWIISDMASAPPAVGVSAMKQYFDEGDTLAEVDVSVRLINADLSPTDLALWRRHKADVSLAVMPGVGHFLMLEDPDEFNRLLANAVKDLARKV
jgi:pimeloyl-ACP methyl ester carboxylesterase